MKTAIISTILIAAARANILDETSNFIGKYYNINYNVSSSGCYYQPFSASNSTAPVVTACNEDTNQIYEIVGITGGARIRHINDNKCLYIDSTTNELSSWECWEDSNMEFKITYNIGFGYALKHITSGLCVNNVSGTLQGVSCSNFGVMDDFEWDFLDEVFPYYNTSLFVTSNVYGKIRPSEGTYSVYVQNSSSSILDSIPYFVPHVFHKFVDAGDNTFRIQSILLGKCAYIDATTKDLYFYSCWDDSNMKFYLYKYKYDLVRIVHVDSGLCLTGDTHRVYAHECGSYDEYYNNSSGSNIYSVVNSSYTSNTYKVKYGGQCLDMYGNLYECQVWDSQNITFIDNGNGTVRIRSLLTPVCISVDSNNGVYSAACSSTDPEMQFEIIQVTLLYQVNDIKIRHKTSGLCLAYSGSTGDAITVDCDGEGNYKATFVVQ